MTAAVTVLVEGESDRVALLAVAALTGRSLAGAEIVVLGGATNVGRWLTEAGADVPVLGLYDAPEERWFRNGLQRAGYGRVRDRDDLEDLGFFACDRDLEDELIRALGVARVQEVVEQQGELASFRTLQNQPFQRTRTPEQQLHRFIGTRSGRKALYAGLLASALDPDEVPRPLVELLGRV